MSRRTERGLALVLVLWSLILLTTIGMSFGYAVRVETAMGSALSDQVRAQALAAGGVRIAVAGLLAADEEQRWLMDGTVHEIPWRNARLRASVRTEGAKIDLNYAPKELLMGLFTNLLPDADAGSLADAVLERRERASAQAATAESSRDSRRPSVAAAGTAAGGTAPAFASVDELVRVPGFTSTSVLRVRPYLTVHSGRPQVDATSADVEVLAAVPGISRDAAIRFVQDRAERPGGEEGLDLSSFGEGASFLDAQPGSRVANVRAVALLEGGAAALVDTVLKVGGGEQGMEILEWRAVPVRAGGAEGFAE